jgi:site-specific DNA recombinase
MLDKIRSKKLYIRAALYARFSSDNQREESIDAQLRALKDYSRRNDIIVVNEYVDKAKSATTDNRPEFLHMISDAKKNMFDVVLVHKLDRFARNRQDSIGYRMELKRNGVTLISILEIWMMNALKASFSNRYLKRWPSITVRTLLEKYRRG